MQDDLPADLKKEMDSFDGFLAEILQPNIKAWEKENRVPPEFFQQMGAGGWFGFGWDGNRMLRKPGLRETLILERLAQISPGVAVTVLIASDLGMTALEKFGSERLQQLYAAAAVRGETLICIGNSENLAGSDAAGIAMTADQVDGGWRLSGAKAYVTNGLISDLMVVTAVSNPDAERSQRMSMFLVDLSAKGISRRRLNKKVWIPSDLTRIDLKNVFVPDDHLLGKRGHGLQQVLSIFTHSRIPIAGLALGTAAGAFDLALERTRKRKIFGRSIADFQSKAFEAADLFARLEAARQVVYRAATVMDSGADFRLEASLAKYLAVDIAQKVGPWAADIFGAVSVVAEHPIHKFPMDAWAVSLAEGTQDVQKLVIFRELLKHNQKLGQF